MPSPPTMISFVSEELLRIDSRESSITHDRYAASIRLSGEFVASLERSQNIMPPRPKSSAHWALRAIEVGVSNELNMSSEAL